MRETEALVRKLCGAGEGGGMRPPAAGAELAGVIDELYGLLEAPVSIRSGKRGGKIEIAYRDQAEFDRLVALLRSLSR